MFIHSKKVKTRIFASILLLASGYLLYVFNPAPGHWLIWLLRIFFLLILVFAGYIFVVVAGKEKPAALPDPTKWNGPNQIPRSTRILNSLYAAGLTCYLGYGLWIDDIYVPAKRGYGTHFQGPSAWWLAIALALLATHLLVEVIDHYDRRNNERTYTHLKELAVWFSATFYVAALISHMTSP